MSTILPVQNYKLLHEGDMAATQHGLLVPGIRCTPLLDVAANGVVDKVGSSPSIHETALNSGVDYEWIHPY